MRALAIVAVLGMDLGLATAAFADRIATLRSYWNEEHTAILSDLDVLRDDGTREQRQVLGGSVDGIAMVQIPLYARAPTLKAFVPEVTSDRKRLRWNGSCVFITPDLAGTGDIAGTEEHTAIAAAAENWNRATGSCSYLHFVTMPPEAREVGLDGKNIVKFREELWCRPDQCSDPKKHYDASATAITTLFLVDQPGRVDDGLILDTDIEVNAVNFGMAVGCETRCQTASHKTPVEDLENTITHELGHVLGLGHTCWDEGSQKFPDLDSQGHVQPACDPESNLPDSIRGATMFNFQLARETSKRTPEPDDVDGVCTNYPIAADPGLCEPVVIPPSGCCSVAGGRDGRAGLAGGLIAALAALQLVRARACSRNRRP